MKKNYCEVTVRRPNGQTETIIHPKVDVMTDNIIAIYHPTNPVWPATLRIRLVCVSGSDQSKPSRYMWTANGAGNGTKDATINAAAMAPKRSYSTRHAAIAAAKRRGWMVDVPETPESIAAAAMGRKGGKSKSAAKVTAARRNVAAARAAIDPEKRAKAVAESNRRRAKK